MFALLRAYGCGAARDTLSSKSCVRAPRAATHGGRGCCCAPCVTLTRALARALYSLAVTEERPAGQHGSRAARRRRWHFSTISLFKHPPWAFIHSGARFGTAVDCARAHGAARVRVLGRITRHSYYGRTTRHRRNSRWRSAALARVVRLWQPGGICGSTARAVAPTSRMQTLQTW